MSSTTPNKSKQTGKQAGKQAGTKTGKNTSIDTRDAILRASLMHVPFDGWCIEALEAGAKDAGFGPAEVAAHFPGGAIDAITAHSALADADMIAAFEGLSDQPEKIHLMIRTMILIRLEQASLHKEAVRRALSTLALPSNAVVSGKTLYQTVDAMWRAAGQRDTDFSFYTKRATLAAVYSSTLLAWVADTNDDMAAIEAFLDRRLGDVARIPKMSSPLKTLFGAGQKMASNMAGAMGRRAGRRNADN